MMTCKQLETLDGVFQAAQEADSLQESSDPACMDYDHYRDIFDEIFLSIDEKYGGTPKARLQRQSVSFTELYRRGAVTDGMMFRMTCDGEIYQARTVLVDDRCSCYFQVLDEWGKPFVKDGQVVGIYENPSQAGVDVINQRRERKGISGRVKTLRGTTAWTNDAGLDIKDLMDRY